MNANIAVKPFTLSNLEALNPCSEALAWARTQPDMVAAWYACQVPSYLFWALERVAPLTKEQVVQLALAFAESVLPIFEKANPLDGRPRAAIEAAKHWLSKQDQAAVEAARAAAETAARAAETAARAAAWAAQCDIIRSLIPCPITNPQPL